MSAAPVDPDQFQISSPVDPDQREKPSRAAADLPSLSATGLSWTTKLEFDAPFLYSPTQRVKEPLWHSWVLGQ